MIITKIINWRGASCTYQQAGQGEAVVLLHGFVEEGSMWQKTKQKLLSTHRVIVPDLPGFGSSQLPKKHKRLMMEDYADFVIEVCKQENVNAFHLFGHSMGGYIALAIADKIPQKIMSLGLINSHCFADTKEKKANRKKGNAFIAQYGSRPFVKEILPQLFTPTFLRKNKLQLHQLIKQAANYSPEALMAANAAMAKRADRSDMLRQLNVPVLLVSGETDEAVPLASSLRQASIPKFADFQLFKKSKHIAPLEEPVRFHQVLLNFLLLNQS